MGFVCSGKEVREDAVFFAGWSEGIGGVAHAWGSGDEWSNLRDGGCVKEDFSVGRCN